MPDGSRPHRRPLLQRLGAPLAWLNAVVAIGLMLVFLLVLPSPATSADHQNSTFELVFFSVVFLLLVLGLALMGALIVTRRPDHPIGWLFAASALAIAVPDVAGGYAALSVERYDRSLPATAFAAWLGSWPSVLMLTMLLVFVPLLFPTGRLPSPRWRPALLLGFIGPIPALLYPALRPGEIVGYPGVMNPFGVPGAGPLLDAAQTVSNVVAVPLFFLVVASVVMRYRRGSFVERQQIKWFAYVAAISAFTFALAIPNNGAIADAAWQVGMVSLAAMPIVIGLAILRYRLFDIDRLINRTIVYLALTALLVALEVGGILVLRLILEPITGETNIAVAATTLGVAAAFQPLRRRLQAGVDRRFYRSRYDAERIVASFAGGLRSEVSLDRLTAELEGTISGALHPASVSVWLRPAQPGR